MQFSQNGNVSGSISWAVLMKNVLFFHLRVNDFGLCYNGFGKMQKRYVVLFCALDKAAKHFTVRDPKFQFSYPSFT